MKQLIFFAILSYFVVTQHAFELELQDFKDPIELPIYQEAIRNMKPNFTNIERERRIVGGEISQFGQFPYTVALHMRSRQGMFVCGGALIKYNWVLTAAHCIEGFNSIQVIVGTINRISGPSVFNITVSHSRDLIPHPQFNPTTISNDIGLIRLRTATPSLLDHTFVDVISLPTIIDSQIDLTGRMSTVSGFGATGFRMPPSEVLRFIKVPVISNQECSQVFGNAILSSNLCVSTIGGRSPCPGDSGGPLTTQIDLNRTVIIGVVSFGAEDCGIEVPVAFARVTSFLPWIESVIGSGTNILLEKFVGILIMIILFVRNLI
ncbi:hypothetical protein ACKWTF_013646 [Chironomus riparius]